MTEMVTSGSMSGDEKRSDGLLGENGQRKTPFAVGAAGPVRHRAPPQLYQLPWSDYRRARAGRHDAEHVQEAPTLSSLEGLRRGSGGRRPHLATGTRRG